MTGILKNGIAERVFVAVDVLGPVFAVLATIYPSFVEFSLDDEYAVLRDYQMVYLSGASRRVRSRMLLMTRYSSFGSLARMCATRLSPTLPFDLRSQKPRKIKMAIMAKVNVIVRYFDYLCKCT